MSREDDILRIGRVVNKILNSGVAVQPNTLLHKELNDVVSIRKYEVCENELEGVLFSLKIIKDAMWTYCPEYENQILVLDDIIKALRNEK